MPQVKRLGVIDMKKLIKFWILFSVAHIGISIALFLAFGLGLEDRSRGSDFFWVLQQPMLSLLDQNWPAGLQMFMLVINSAVWGFLFSLITVLCRKLSFRKKEPQTQVDKR